MKSARMGLEEIDAEKIVLCHPGRHVLRQRGRPRSNVPEAQRVPIKPDNGGAAGRRLRWWCHNASPEANEFAALDVRAPASTTTGPPVLHPDLPVSP